VYSQPYVVLVLYFKVFCRFYALFIVGLAGVCDGTPRIKRMLHCSQDHKNAAKTVLQEQKKSSFEAEPPLALAVQTAHESIH